MSTRKNADPHSRIDLRRFKRSPVWRVLHNVRAKTMLVAFDLKLAMNRLAIRFGERFTQARG